MPIKVSDGVSTGKRNVKPNFVMISIFETDGIERPSSTWSGRKVVCGVDVWLDRGGDERGGG